MPIDCPNCKRQVPDSEFLCPYCGKSIKPPTEKQLAVIWITVVATILQVVGFFCLYINLGWAALLMLIGTIVYMITRLMDK